MEAEFVLFCYVVTTRSIAQKSVCDHVPGTASRSLSLESDPLSRAAYPPTL